MVGLYKGTIPSSGVTFLYNGGTPKSPLHYRTLLGSTENRNIGITPYGNASDLQAYFPGETINLVESLDGGVWTYKNTGTTQSDYMGS